MSLIAGLQFQVTPAYIDGVWEVYDVDNDGVLGLEEFQRLFTILESKHANEVSVFNPLASHSADGVSYQL